MTLLSLILLVAAFVLFAVAGVYKQGTGNIHFGWLGAALLAAIMLLQHFKL